MRYFSVVYMFYRDNCHSDVDGVGANHCKRNVILRHACILEDAGRVEEHLQIRDSVRYQQTA